MNNAIMLVEDEPDIAQIVQKFLIKAGYDCAIFTRLTGVLDEVRLRPPAAIILDVMLPDGDGMALAKEIRTFSDVPIIMLTAKTEEADRIQGFGIGVDDYVCKPFSAPELVMRVNVILKRSQTKQTQDNFVIHKDNHTATFQGKSISLTGIECLLLLKLTAHPKNIFSRDAIMSSIYADHRIVSDRTVDSHIRNLRKKMRQLHSEHDFIEAVYGVGYRYNPHQE